MNGMSRITGAALAGLAHIHQSVNDILNTPRGSRRMRMSYGAEVPDLIDQPGNPTTRVRLYAAVVAALSAWEPRIKVTGLNLSVAIDGSAMLTIDGQARVDGRIVPTTFDVMLGAG